MILNAFQSVRPRGTGASAQPAKHKRTKPRKTPQEGLLLDSRGRAVVGIERRTQGAITIENRAQSQASVDKRMRISKAGTK